MPFEAKSGLNFANSGFFIFIQSLKFKVSSSSADIKAYLKAEKACANSKSSAQWTVVQKEQNKETDLMAKILLNNVEIGMELDADVVDRQGRVLLKSGITLNEKHLRVFNTWGILEVDIKGDVEAEETKKHYPPELIEEASQLAKIHFQHNDLSHPVIKNLFDYWQNYYMDNKVS